MTITTVTYRHHQKKLLWLALIITMSCKEQYMPPVFSININYLVVDGIIVSGSDSTVIRLSRTTPVKEKVALAPETGAQVSIIGEANDVHPLTDQGDGRYTSPGLNLNTTQHYQLKITTTADDRYESDFVEAKNSPLIDSVYWSQDNDLNVQVSVATHDPQNQARYYKWDFEETWLYRSAERTYVDWIDNHEVIRTNEQQIYTCWSTNKSGDIILYSTAKLTNDVAAQIHLATVPHRSEKIAYEYSIAAKQYSLTKDGYTFWDAMRSNTEQLGSLFDRQPSQIPTNIRCVNDSSKAVIGFASVSSLQVKRIFISNADVVDWAGLIPYFVAYGRNCGKICVAPADMIGYFPPSGNGNYVFFGEVTGCDGYVVMEKECADCREHGGTNIKPPFWP